MRSLAHIAYSSKGKGIVLLLLAIVLLGTFLRAYDLGTESIWVDEASSIKLAVKDFISVIREAGYTQNHPPLYFVILHFWIRIFGDSEVATRSLSAIFGVASILLIYHVGSMLFYNRRIGLLVALLTAVSTYLIFYSQETRAYTLLLLLSLLSHFFFIRILRGGGYWQYIFYFTAIVLLGYTHIYGSFIIASQALSFLLFWGKHRTQRIRFLVTLVSGVIMLLPLLHFIGGRVTRWVGETGGWGVPTLTTFKYTLTRFSGYGTGQEYIMWIFITMIFLSFFSFKLQGKYWNWKGPVKSLNRLAKKIKFDHIEEQLIVFIWLFFSILAPFILSQFISPIYLTRYLVGASP
ncbi:glycosyltransferase family 39 protein, partial [Chloroflexota bacterium]